MQSTSSESAVGLAWSGESNRSISMWIMVYLFKAYARVKLEQVV